MPSLIMKVEQDELVEEMLRGTLKRIIGNSEDILAYYGFGFRIKDGGCCCK